LLLRKLSYGMIDKRIIGTWRLRSTKAVDDDGKTLPPPLGPNPNEAPPQTDEVYGGALRFGASG
jgi:hypothetical protein